MKDIKKSIAHWCAVKLLQKELPESGTIRFFPDIIADQVRMRTNLRTKCSKGKKLRLIHSFGQIKKVLAKSPKELVQQYYEKHRKTLSTPTQPTPKDILELAYRKGQEFGRIVNKFYDPFHTTIPSQSATFELKRSEGGKKEALYKKNTPKDQFRCEPTVLFLCGAPGTGKSRLVMDIVRTICNREELDMFNCVFTRNCNTPHWDGYAGQAITVLDDWNQDNQQQCAADVLELISLVTDNAYPLPMAELSQKGTLFTSRYIIVCSNETFGLVDEVFPNRPLMAKQDYILRDDRALLRRLHHPYVIYDARGENVCYSPLSNMKERIAPRGRVDISCSRQYKCELDKVCCSRKIFVATLVRDLINDRCQRELGIVHSLSELNTDYPWRQVIYNVDDWVQTTDGHNFRVKDRRVLEYPLSPPSELPRVKAHAVPKELGARIITKSDEYLHVLKPFQMALSKGLGTKWRFKPTRGVPLNELLCDMRPLKDNEFYLSGDYEAATDGMHMDFSKEILEGILSEIDHEPTREWARYEHGKHIVFYPEETGLEPIEQVVGQLMGSLLSFPILCIANDTLTEYAGIDERDRLINGDDLFAIADDKKYAAWKKAGTSCGMKPSLGKNFMSRYFGTFNSQLLVSGKVLPYTNLNLVFRDKLQEEKEQRIKDRKTQVTTIVSCFTKALAEGIKKSTIVENNLNRLKRTPQSLDISYSLGGLGYTNTREMTYTDKLCYLSKLIPNVSRVLPGIQTPEGYEWIAYPVRGLSGDISSVGSQLNELILQKISSDNSKPTDEFSSDTLTFKDIARVHKKVVSSRILREMLRNINIHNAVNLDDGFTNYEVKCVPKKESNFFFIQKYHDFINDVGVDMLV